MGRVILRAGNKFGLLEVIRNTGEKVGGHYRWECKCECGKDVVVQGRSLISGNTQSCGCLRAKNLETDHKGVRVYNGKVSYKGHELYGVWCTMRNRCNNPTVKSYPSYGGRGITVCERWSSFENFLEDMGERPSELYSIERIDNEGPYSPDNCKWATRLEQSGNKRNSRYFTLNGETLHLAEWARRLNCKPGAITNRLDKGMPLGQALTMPIPERPNSKLTLDQALEIRLLHPVESAVKLSKKYSVSKKTILNIIHRVTFNQPEKPQ